LGDGISKIGLEKRESGTLYIEGVSIAIIGMFEIEMRNVIVWERECAED